MRNPFTALLMTTALVVPLASGVQAQNQSAENACERLAQVLEQELPEDVRSEEEQIRSISEEGEGELCLVELERVQQVAGIEADDDMDAVESDSETATVAETAETRLTLQDEVTVEGTVFLDQTPPTVDVTSGETEVDIEQGRATVDIAEQAGEIIVRQRPAMITVDMPQPTIRIEQPAPEIIITMPDPSVNVGSAEPRVEVRQADPRITVNQTPPSVDLELRRVEEGNESGGFRVNDRRSGQEYAAGEAGEGVAMEDAEISLSTSEPIVRMVESSENAEVRMQRAEPQIRFEQAEPQVEFSSAGEPTLEFVQSGEPVVQFQTGEGEAASEGQDENSDEGQEDEAGMEAAPQEDAQTDDTATTEEDATSEDMAAEDMPTDGAATDDMAAEDMPAEGEASEDMAADGAETDDAATDMGTEAETDMADDRTDETPMDQQVMERDGYAPVDFESFDFTTLEGATIYGSQDETVGDVSDLVLADGGVIEAVVVGIGGFLGIGEREVAIPFDRLSILQGEEQDDVRVYVNATREELEGMSAYDG